MTDIEDKIDEKLRKKFGQEIEQNLDQLGSGRIQRLGILWVQFFGVVLLLISIIFSYKHFRDHNHPTLELKIVGYEIKENVKDPYYPKYEYEIDGKTYSKVSETGFWRKVFQVGESIKGEYIEGLPESAVIGSVSGKKGKGIEELLIIGGIGFFLILFPILMRRFFAWDKKMAKKKGL